MFHNKPYLLFKQFFRFFPMKQKHNSNNKRKTSKTFDIVKLCRLPVRNSFIVHLKMVNCDFNIVRAAVVHILYCVYLGLLLWQAVELKNTWWTILLSSLEGLVFVAVQIVVPVLYWIRYDFIFIRQCQNRS